jgi:hypothetical protein
MENKVETKKIATKSEAKIVPFTKKDQTASKGKKEAKTVVATPTPAPKPEVKPVVNVEPPKPTAQVIEAKIIEQPAPLTLESLAKAIQLLRRDFDAQTLKIEEILMLMAKKRKPATNGNGRVQILDTKTQITYKSKNNVYQTLLRNDELTDLISQGVFGADPKKNSFGWYALNRAFPGRFVEVHPDAPAKS